MEQDRIRKLHAELLQHLSHFYQSHRTRCLMLKTDEGNFNIDFCKVYQPFTVTDREDILWESDSLLLIEETRNLSKEVDLLHPLHKTSYRIGKTQIELIDRDTKQSVISDWYYGKSWKKRYHSSSDGIVFRYSSVVERSNLNISQEDIREEIRFHPISPFQHSSDLTESLGGREAEFLKKTIVEVVTPFWARVSNLEIDGRNVTAEYEIPQNMEKRVKVWKSIETSDGTLIKEEVGFKGTDESKGEIQKFIGEYVIPNSLKEAKRITLTLNIDNKYGIGWERKEVGPSKLILWSLLEEQEAKKGRLQSMIAGEKERSHSLGQFEYAIGLLLTALGFRIVYTGRLFQPGPDLLAISPDENTILVVECGRAKFVEKLAACSERLEYLKRAYSEYSFLGTTFTAVTVSQEMRQNQSYPGVALFDGDDIERLIETARRRPDPKMFLNYLRSSYGMISRIRF